MKNVKEVWAQGVDWLFNEMVISFYVFFTTIFIECAWVWIYLENNISKLFIGILLAYILNVLICSFFKGMFSGTKAGIVFTILYCLVALGLTVIGCFIDVWISIILAIIPVIVSFIWIQIRDIQTTTATETLTKKSDWYFSQLIVVILPIIVFTVFVASIPSMHLALKIAIPCIYTLIIPFICYYEDFTSFNIFELAFEIDI